MIRNRFKQFWYRLNWLATLMGNRWVAFFYLLKGKIGWSTLGQGNYHGITFLFRPQDLGALKEVLIDCEYNFLRSFLQGLSRHDPIVLDIGAHIGTFALWVFSVVPQAKIWSLEASPKNFSVLKNNSLKASQQNWHTLQGAAWHNNEEVPILESKNTMSFRFSSEGIARASGYTLQDLIEQTGYDQIDLMKVDIEGSEENFLCVDLMILSKIRALVVELHPHYCDTDRVRKFLGQSYQHITEVPQRFSNKPLLFCLREG